MLGTVQDVNVCPHTVAHSILDQVCSLYQIRVGRNRFAGEPNVGNIPVNENVMYRINRLINQLVLKGSFPFQFEHDNTRVLSSRINHKPFPCPPQRSTFMTRKARRVFSIKQAILIGERNETQMRTSACPSTLLGCPSSLWMVCTFGSRFGLHRVAQS